MVLLKSQFGQMSQICDNGPLRVMVPVQWMLCRLAVRGKLQIGGASQGLYSISRSVTER